MFVPHSVQHNVRPASSSGRGTMGNGAPSSTYGLADKARLANIRRSTPDSEALASDDEEHDTLKPTKSLPAHQHAPTQRRTSWLSEIQSGFPRRSSVTTTTSNTSQPVTPSSEQGAWLVNNPLGRVASNPTTTAAWSSGGLWGVDQRRDAPSRLNEVSMQSPPTGYPSPQARNPGDERVNPTTLNGDQLFPFSILLHPTPKTYRSKSYSVGQLETEEAQDGPTNQSPAAAIAAPSQSPIQGRQRSTPQQVLLHRPSRPSMLSEVTEGINMAAMQESRNEVQRTSAGTSISPNGLNRSRLEVASNSGLGQALNSRARNRASTTTKNATGSLHSSTQLAFGQISEQALGDDDDDDDDEDTLDDSLVARFSGLSGLGAPHSAEGSRRQWQTSLGFGDLADIPQSRRHSLADIPTRRNSLVAAAANDHAIFQPSTASAMHMSMDGPVAEDQRDAINRAYAANYFSGIVPATRNRLESSQSPPQDPISRHFYPPTLAPQGFFARPPLDIKLHVVGFKCSRAEIYYVEANTGLEIPMGEMVIVEADRGFDLGTVMKANCSWEEAQDSKAALMEENRNWLLMFSHHGQNQDGIASATAAPVMAHGGQSLMQQTRAGGRGVNTGSGLAHQGAGSISGLKRIRRLAQPHEIASLREKEGNEAKAKRRCQQKVDEHGLDMEILDAEFQMDWKKLMFFYNADSYVNFNALVTDLFKIYKTRIWMSAVNPASLSAPANPPHGLGPGVVRGRDSPMDPRSGGGWAFSGGYGNAGFTQTDLDAVGSIPPHQNPNSFAYNDFARGGTRQGQVNNQGSPVSQAPFGYMAAASPIHQGFTMTTTPGQANWGSNPDAGQAPGGHQQSNFSNVTGIPNFGNSYNDGMAPSFRPFESAGRGRGRGNTGSSVGPMSPLGQVLEDRGLVQRDAPSPIPRP